MSNCNAYIKSKLQLKKDENVIPPINSVRCFGAPGLTSVKNDQDYIDYDIEQSKGTYNYVSSDHNQNNRQHLIESATCSPTINFKDGKGTSLRDIDIDSKVTFSKVKYERKHQKQLHERPFRTMPYIGRGTHKVNDESFIMSGETTKQGKQCSSLAGVTIDNFFTPLVPSLQATVQNSKHIIPEESKRDWVRGGMSTRNIIKDIDYFSRCQDDDSVKQALVEKKQFMHKQ
jgi:hypothetical protein